MAGHRDYKAEYRRRQQLARERGFTSYWQARNATRPRTTEGLARLLPQSTVSKTAHTNRNPIPRHRIQKAGSLAGVGESA